MKTHALYSAEFNTNKNKQKSNFCLYISKANLNKTTLKIELNYFQINELDDSGEETGPVLFIDQLKKKQKFAPLNGCACCSV